MCPSEGPLVSPSPCASELGDDDRERSPSGKAAEEWEDLGATLVPVDVQPGQALVAAHVRVQYAQCPPVRLTPHGTEYFAPSGHLTTVGADGAQYAFAVFGPFDNPVQEDGECADVVAVPHAITLPRMVDLAVMNYTPLEPPTKAPTLPWLVLVDRLAFKLGLEFEGVQVKRFKNAGASVTWLRKVLKTDAKLVLCVKHTEFEVVDSFLESWFAQERVARRAPLVVYPCSPEGTPSGHDVCDSVELAIERARELLVVEVNRADVVEPRDFEPPRLLPDRLWSQLPPLYWVGVEATLVPRSRCLPADHCLASGEKLIHIVERRLKALGCAACTIKRRCDACAKGYKKAKRKQPWTDEPLTLLLRDVEAAVVFGYAARFAPGCSPCGRIAVYGPVAERHLRRAQLVSDTLRALDLTAHSTLEEAVRSLAGVPNASSTTSNNGDDGCLPLAAHDDRVGEEQRVPAPSDVESAETGIDPEEDTEGKDASSKEDKEKGKRELPPIPEEQEADFPWLFYENLKDVPDMMAAQVLPAESAGREFAQTLDGFAQVAREAMESVTTCREALGGVTSPHLVSPRDDDAPERAPTSPVLTSCWGDRTGTMSTSLNSKTASPCTFINRPPQPAYVFPTMYYPTIYPARTLW